MLRPAGQWLAAFGEPLHRIPRGAVLARQVYYRPLPVVWLSALAHGFDASPRVLRLGGLGVGALCLALFAMLSWRLLGDAPASLFAALFVAVHPVGIESFLWISAISGPWCTLFSIAALGLALAAFGSPSAPRALALAAASLFALLAALASQERAAVVPALLAALLISASRLERLRPASGALGRGAALVAAQAALVALFVLAWRPAVLGAAWTPLHPIGGSAETQLLSALASWPASLGWLLLPWVSTTNDGIRIVTSAGDPGPWLGAALALCSLAAWALLLRARRPVAALGLAWIWIAFLPTSGLLPLLHARGERYLLLSAFGAALLLADLGAAAVARLARPRLVGVSLACAVLGLLAWRSAVRLPDWRSDETLFGVELARDPGYREGRFLLASALFEQGRHAEVEVWLRPLLRPERPPTRTGYLNLLPVYELACANALALGRPEAALELEPRAGPLAASAAFQVCLGGAEEALGRVTAALLRYRAAADVLGAPAPRALRERIERLGAGRAR